MLIAQISDTHVSLDLPEGEQRLANLRRTVAAINGLDPQPDVVIHTGDLANRGQPQEYAAARAVLDCLRAPFHPVPGNRDHRERLHAAFVTWPCFAADLPFVQYALDGHAVRLLGLDTVSGDGQKGHYCEARIAGLAAALAVAPERPTAVFMHHPPFAVEGARDPFQFEPWPAAERLRDTLAAAGQVIRIFCGHAHRARDVDLNGIHASTMTSIAVDLRLDEDPQCPSAAPRFQLHRHAAGRGFSTTSVEVAG